MRHRIKRHASHWKSLPIKERKKVRKAIRKFDKLPAHKREKLRKRWRDMPAEKRRKIHGAFDTFEQLLEERRREIREKVRNMSPEERREFLKEIAQQSTQSTTEAGEEKSQP
jgi:acyl-CoA reductase-like NAD-dependent aldehyde dehydrogenase